MESARKDCCSCLDEGEAFAADADACDSGCSFMAAKGEGLRSDMGGDVEAPTCEEMFGNYNCRQTIDQPPLIKRAGCF
jgi:hypothetical protein